MVTRISYPLTRSALPRKQRKTQAHLPLHHARKVVAAHLSEELLLKYNRRAVPVCVGDTAKVLRGSYRGLENKVTSINTTKGSIVVEGVTVLKADGKKKPRPLDPSNCVLTKLNLTDKYRRAKLLQTVEDADRKKLEAEAESEAQAQAAEAKKVEAAAKAEEKQAEAADKALERAAEAAPEGAARRGGAHGSSSAGEEGPEAPTPAPTPLPKPKAEKPATGAKPAPKAEKPTGTAPKPKPKKVDEEDE